MEGWKLYGYSLYKDFIYLFYHRRLYGDVYLKSVHVHLLLLGWGSMMVAGILYHIFQEAGHSKLGKNSSLAP